LLAFPATIAPARCSVSPAEAQALVANGAFVLDVRSRRRYEEDGHIPGAVLLPGEALASAPAVVPEDGRPILVVCERGARSRQVATLLGDAGISSAWHLEGGMVSWPGPREHIGMAPLGPSPWLLSNALLAPPGARTLDVACGRGRHALLLASAGSSVRALDRDPSCVARLRAIARGLRLPLDAELVDLERSEPALGEDEWELVLVFDQLVRPLFPRLVRALRPGGILICEGLLREHALRHGLPSRREQLLEPGELPALVAPLEIVRQREGEAEGYYLASVAARKRWPSRRSASSQRRDAASVAAAPASQRRPAQTRSPGSSARGQSTPWARKR
jgi:rhodanese-related sulfurtransferase